MITCAHEGWGEYESEKGDCPPPAEMRSIDGGVEGPVCEFHVTIKTEDDAMTRVFAMNRETATTSRETR